ncbi:hypothetical protein ACH4C2_36910 [Streptomyces sp. NPDC018057]|uniref:hypothetical protein n=1 Tax=unclassified Streptomyces TaxID=2593676 RepID=UPI0037BB3787
MGDGTLRIEPNRLLAGGDATDEIGAAALRAADVFATDTAYDPQDPPWGNDHYGRDFAVNYIPVHTQLRDAVNALANALHSAAALTRGAGEDFKKAQEEAMRHIEEAQHQPLPSAGSALPAADGGLAPHSGVHPGHV